MERRVYGASVALKRWSAATAVAICLSAATPAGAVVVYGDWLRLNGLLESYTALNTEDFSDTELTTVRNMLELQTELWLLRKKFGLRHFKLDATLRGWNDAVYRVNTNKYGVGAKPEVLSTVDSSVGPVDLLIIRNPNSPRGKEKIFSDRRRGDLEWSTDKFDGHYLVPVREAYVEFLTDPLFGDSGGNTLFVRLGKQQVVWGKTDFFRLADIINPIDYEQHAFLEFYEEIRLPQWILHMVYGFGSIGPFSDLSVEVDWNFDQPLGSHLGQRGTPYAHPFGHEIGSFRILYEEGIPDGQIGGVPVPIPPGVIGLRNSILPDHSLENTQYGGRIQGVWQGVTWSIDYWHGYQDLPTFVLVPSAVDPIFIPLFGPKSGKAPLYDMRYYKRDTIGGSFDWPEDWTQSVWRLELNYAFNEHMNDTSDLEDAVQTSDVLRYVIAWDRPTFIKPINPTRTFLLSGQLFMTHVLDHKGRSRGPGTIFDATQPILTFLALGFYHNDRIQPVFFAGYQFFADAILVGGWLQYILTDHIDVTLGMNSISGRARIFDTGAGGGPQGLVPGGLIEEQNEAPWGYAKEGFGAWRYIDDFWLRIRYRL